MKLNYLAIIAISALLTGCAHPIIITPDAQKISSNLSPNDNRKYIVGYYISPKDKKLEVTTLAGGGDNISYYPYRDIEDSYKAMLSNVFDSVTTLKSMNKNDNTVDLIIVPKIITASGSTGFFTWPPTNFIVDLTNTITTPNGKIVGEPRAIGTGGASTSEKLTDHGIAGRRAMEDALLKTQVLLTKIELQKTPSKSNVKKSNGNSNKSISDRLKSLKELKELGLINEQEFLEKKKKIIDSL